MIVNEKHEGKLLKKIGKKSMNYLLLDLEEVPFKKKKQLKMCIPLLGIVSQAENIKSTVSGFDPANPIVTDVLFKAMQVIMSDEQGLCQDDLKEYIHTRDQIDGFVDDNDNLEIMLLEDAELLIIGFSWENLRNMPEDYRTRVLEEYCKTRYDYSAGNHTLDGCVERLQEIKVKYNKTKVEFKKERLAEHAAYMDKEDDKLRRQDVILQEIKEKTKNGESLSLAERCFLNPDFIDKIELPKESLKEMTSSLIN